MIRKLISSSLLLLFVCLLVSAYWLFFIAQTDQMSTWHISSGLLLAGLAIWHLWSHRKSWLKYLTVSPKHIIPAATFSVAIFIGATSQISPFDRILGIGGASRFEAQDHSLVFIPLEEGQGREFQVDSTNVEAKGAPLKVSARVGGSYSDTMVMVMWVEDLEGNFIETLYATNRFGKGIITNPNEIGYVKRPQAVPHWMFKRSAALGIEADVPTVETAVVDGLTGATPDADFIINTKLTDPNLRQFVLKFEANQSFDWNEYYSEDRFPQDKVYSGPGFVGQPAVIYQANVDLDAGNDFFVLEAVGRAHHSGQDGQIYTDMENLTTTLSDFYRIVVESGDL